MCPPRCRTPPGARCRAAWVKTYILYSIPRLFGWKHLFYILYLGCLSGNIYYIFYTSPGFDTAVAPPPEPVLGLDKEHRYWLVVSAAGLQLDCDWVAMGLLRDWYGIAVGLLWDWFDREHRYWLVMNAAGLQRDCDWVAMRLLRDYNVIGMGLL